MPMPLLLAALAMTQALGGDDLARPRSANAARATPLSFSAPALLVPDCKSRGKVSGTGWQNWRRPDGFGPAPGAAALVPSALFLRSPDIPLAGATARQPFSCVTISGMHPGAADLGKGAGGSACLADYWSPQIPPSPQALTCHGSVLRFSLRPGDVDALDARRDHAAERAEIGEWFKHAPTGEIWFAFSMRILPGAPTTSGWLELGQLHNTQDPGERSSSPAFEQGLAAGDVFRVNVRANTQDPVQDKTPAIEVYRDANFGRGTFHNFVYRINYTPTGAGALDMWLDGVQKVAYRGPIGYVDRLGPYLKFGIYREPSQDTFGVDYANIEVGGAELRDRVAHPRPIDDGN